MYSYDFPDQTVSFNTRDFILYSLGIGSLHPQFIYELDPHFKVHPLYTLVLALKGDSQEVNVYKDRFIKTMIPPKSVGLPDIDLNKLVHGEQSIEIYKSLNPSETKLNLKSRLSNVYDTGTSMIIQNESKFYTCHGDLVSRLVTTAFVIGGGGFNGLKPPKPNVLPIPPRQEDYSIDFQTAANQAAIYRLSGDYNPLHIDPSIGTNLGMKGAILHGLCTLGIASNGIIESVCNGDPTRLKSIKTRFLNPVYPGDKLTTKIWVLDTKTAVFVTLFSTTKVLSGSCEFIGTSTAHL